MKLKLLSLVNVRRTPENQWDARFPYAQYVLVQTEDGSAHWCYYSGALELPDDTRGAERRWCNTFINRDDHDFEIVGYVDRSGTSRPIRSVASALREVERKNRWNAARRSERMAAKMAARSAFLIQMIQNATSVTSLDPQPAD